MRLCFAVGLCLLAAPSPAQTPSPLTTTRVTDRVWRLAGYGNVVVYEGATSLVLIDVESPLDGYSAAQLTAAIDAISPKPIRYAINTHWHPDHVGFNALIGAEAVVVAHHNVKLRMGEAQHIAFFDLPVPASPPPALPEV